MDSKKCKIMIMDDDEFLLKMYAAKFKAAGLEVEAVTSVNAVLEKLRGGYHPDLILLDIVMPGMDGIGLLEVIRRERLAAGAAVMMLTNQNQEADVERAKRLGVDGFLVKAESVPSDVVAEVLSVLKKRKA